MEITNETLSHLLPVDLLEGAIKSKEESDAPLSLLCQVWQVKSPFKSPISLSKMQATPSPQVVPFESRIHYYLLKRKNSPGKKSTPIQLANLFTELNFQQEVAYEVDQVTGKASIFNALTACNFFEEAIEKIESIVHKPKCALNVNAKTFLPDQDKDKENCDPNRMY